MQVSTSAAADFLYRLARLGDDFFIFFFGGAPSGVAGSASSSLTVARVRGDADDAAGDAAGDDDAIFCGDLLLGSFFFSS